MRSRDIILILLKDSQKIKNLRLNDITLIEPAKGLSEKENGKNKSEEAFFKDLFLVASVCFKYHRINMLF